MKYLSFLLLLCLFACELPITTVPPAPTIDYQKYVLPYVELIKDIPNFRQKARVGRKVFFFEEDGVSCASCHLPGKGFTAGKQQSIGKPDDTPPIKSPSSIGMAPNDILLWNGAAGGTAENLIHSKDQGNTANNFMQAVGAITQVLFAQNAHKQPFTRDSLMTADVMDLFKKAYPNVSESRLCEPEDIAECIAAFQLVHLLPDNSRQQQFLRGEISLSQAEINGWKVFDMNCEGCHKAPYMGDNRFTRTTTPPFINELHDGTNASNTGRFSFTGYEEDRGKFRIMRLQTNLIDHGCYGFSCEETDLKKFISKHMSKNKLSEIELDEMISFLNTLRDDDLSKIHD